MVKLTIPVSSLPSAPGVAQRVIALCRQETVELQPLGDAVMADPALSARVLRLAYSPERCLGAPITSVRDAVLLMGARATRLAARFGFEQLGLQRIEIVAAVDNLASQRVAEKAGARHEGLARKRLLIRGLAHDAMIYSLVGEDFGLPTGL